MSANKVKKSSTLRKCKAATNGSEDIGVIIIFQLQIIFASKQFRNCRLWHV